MDVPLPTVQSNVLAFLTDAELPDVVARALGVSMSSDQIVMGGIEKAISQVAHDLVPRTLLIDLTGVPEPLAALDRLAEVCVPGTHVVAIGETNDIRFYKSLRNAGVLEYLHKPVDEAQIKKALTHKPQATAMREISLAAAAPTVGPVVVVGARGGVGTTMVAIALAWLAAERERQRTVLVDLDLVAGSAGLGLDLEGGRGLADALATPDRIDGLLVASATVRHGKFLSLLSSEPNFETRRRLADDAVKRLTAGLRQNFQRIVMDVPHYEPTMLRQALDQATTVVIVTDFSLGGVRDTARLYGFIGKHCPAARRLVVGNRLGVAKKGGLSVTDFEKAISVKFTAVIPEDPTHVAHAVNSGKPVPEAAPGSPAITPLRQIAEAAELLSGTRKKGLLEKFRASLAGESKTKASPT